MDLSIIIVNWNSAEYLRLCLASLLPGLSGVQFEVIVVDNASYDGSEEMVRKEFPEVIFEQSRTNLGFANANNLGYRRSSGKVLLFLNPDTEVIGDAISKMLSYLQSQPRVGAVGCLLLNTDLSVQTSCIQSFPTIWNQVLDADILRRIFPRWSIWGMRPLFDDDNQPAEVEVISGAGFMVKRAVFEEVGLFGEEYFMYVDDLDLSYKIKKAGYRIHYLSDCKIIHHGGKSSEVIEESYFSEVLKRESLAKFLKKTRGSVYSNLFKVITACAAIFRLFLIACWLPFARAISDRIPFRSSFQKWLKILRWALGLERWARPVSS